MCQKTWLLRLGPIKEEQWLGDMKVCRFRVFRVSGLV